jgi:quinol---cytochrome-c reductase cytochrome c subunit
MGRLSQQQIQLVASYVATVIADPATHTARSADGGQIFRLYCSGCHGATGRGGAMARGRNAPNIAHYPAAEALAAMILGRGNMPAFAGSTVDVRQQTAVGLYVYDAIDNPPSPGGHGLGYIGPVSEGAVAGLGLCVLVVVTVWLAWPARKSST